MTNTIDAECTLIASAILPANNPISQVELIECDDTFTLVLFKLNDRRDPYAFELYLKTLSHTYKHAIARSVNNNDMRSLAGFIETFVSKTYPSLSHKEQLYITGQVLSICERAVVESVINDIVAGEIECDHYFVRFEGTSNPNRNELSLKAKAFLYKNDRAVQALGSKSLKTVLSKYDDIVVEAGVYSDVMQKIIKQGNHVECGAALLVNLSGTKDGLFVGGENLTTADRFRMLLDAPSLQGITVFQTTGVVALV